MKIDIEEDKCVAGGQCVMAAPNVFDQRDEDGVVVLIDDNPGEEERDNIQRAIILCPAAALSIGRESS